jgi:quercetin dioxygenase-like cupin family protein
MEGFFVEPRSEVADVAADIKIHRWSEIEYEDLAPKIGRRAIHSDRMTIARIYVKKGGVVPTHQHENEQVSYVLEGRLRFDFGDREEVVSAGEMMQIPSRRPHKVEALEDSVALDIFQPVRDDWLRGDDAYLRNPSPSS